jgi:tetratricopeptide (TPR) repeat protein
MLTPFTDRFSGFAFFLLGILLSGCASVGDQPVNQSLETAVLTTPHSAESPASDADSGGALLDLPDLDLAGEAAADVSSPAPQVDRGNVLAFDQALAALRAGRLQEAESLLLEITGNQPELAGPWVNLGQVYVLLEQYDAARMAFAKAVDANPRSCAAHNQLGVLSRQIGDFSGAEAHYRACLVNVPNYKDAYLNLGILYELYLGRLPQALEAYRRYQLLLTQPDRRVQGWVMDLERRLGV